MTIPEKHQKKIALATLRMSDAGAAIMGGMSKEEAREFLLRLGYSQGEIDREENGRYSKVDGHVILPNGQHIPHESL